MDGDWFEADDDLPVDGLDVLITGYREKTTVRYTDIAHYDEEREGFFESDDEGVEWQYIGVTHWAYLPDAP